MKNPNFIDAAEAVGGIVTVDQLKKQAKVIGSYLESEGVKISHSKCLEAISRASGFHDWNTASAMLKKHEEFLENEFGKLNSGHKRDCNLYATKERIVYCGWQKIGRTIKLPPLKTVTLKVYSTISPYFDPKAVGFYGCYADDTSANAKFMVRSVNVGNIQQLGITGYDVEGEIPIEGLLSDTFCRRGDPALVNWSIFSAHSLGREMDILLFNMDNKREIVASVSVWGNAVTSLDSYP